MGKLRIDPTLIDESSTFEPIRKGRHMGENRDGTRSRKAKSESRKRRSARREKQYA